MNKFYQKQTKTPIPVNISNDDLTMNFDQMFTNMKPEINENINSDDMLTINFYQNEFEEFKKG